MIPSRSNIMLWTALAQVVHPPERADLFAMLFLAGALAQASPNYTTLATIYVSYMCTRQLLIAYCRAELQ